ncbi:alkaline phosphatase family protein [Solirubrobacter ginsenosidimutans]|uniref:Alkaline phosphatase family protein n=1 Tax=Solirubrobacter ginsenosidimutans TaxID=490573 RepID=A0A9X3MUY0_9ACTN|nr:alkaline phosphatase family protein [Solirubrobacter ginsenosidimutans]MDA0163174.1 alkaline phosphatase family protein [Solirubrobacter ginsenosidimutans]
MATGFAELPQRFAALTREHERVAVVLLDAFGWKFVQRHADHPFLQRLAIEPVASQFPSTTTAHLTTLYSGLPVGEHGLYEWQIYEPAVDGIVLPLPFVDQQGEPLTLDPKTFVPSPTFFEQLEVPATALQPQAIWPSTYSSAALAGASVVPFATFEEAAAQLGTRDGLTYVYWDAIDAAGHRFGPSSAEFDAAALHALDALDEVRDTVIAVTADHGQLDVGEIDYLDALWPPLTEHLRHGPAGSARDCFLHVNDPETVVGELANALGERAEVRLASELFDDPGPRLRARLADVCVLPAPGRMAWLEAYPSRQLRFKGHHGGLTPEESQTWIGIMQA